MFYFLYLLYISSTLSLLVYLKMSYKVKRLQDYKSKQFKLSSKSLEDYLDYYALVEWDPLRNGLIYGIVRMNLIYKPWEPHFKSFKLGHYYTCQQKPNHMPYRCRLVFRGSYKECSDQISKEFEKKDSWIQQCHRFNIEKKKFELCDTDLNCNLLDY